MNRQIILKYLPLVLGGLSALAAVGGVLGFLGGLAASVFAAVGSLIGGLAQAAILLAVALLVEKLARDEGVKTNVIPE